MTEHDTPEDSPLPREDAADESGREATDTVAATDDAAPTDVTDDAADTNDGAPPAVTDEAAGDESSSDETEGPDGDADAVDDEPSAAPGGDAEDDGTATLDEHGDEAAAAVTDPGETDTTPPAGAWLPDDGDATTEGDPAGAWLPDGVDPTTDTAAPDDAESEPDDTAEPDDGESEPNDTAAPDDAEAEPDDAPDPAPGPDTAVDDAAEPVPPPDPGVGGDTVTSAPPSTGTGPLSATEDGDTTSADEPETDEDESAAPTADGTSGAAVSAAPPVTVPAGTPSPEPTPDASTPAAPVDDSPPPPAATPDAPSDHEQPATDESGGGRIATGILAAAGKAQKGVDRKRRRFVSGAVLALVIVGAALATVAVLQNRANQVAIREAQLAEARADFATAVVDEAEAHEVPARAMVDDASRLHRALEDHVLVGTRDDDELETATTLAVDRLAADAATLAALGEADPPTPDDSILAENANPVLADLGQLRAEAAAMVEEVAAANAAAVVWSDAVLGVNRALAAHVAELEAEESTSNPTELIALWEAERPGLDAIADAAAVAVEVEGLDAWAGAHADYADAARAWIDEAIALLEANDLDEYNEAFEATFGTDDPFGFAAAVEAATPAALASPALTGVAALEARAEVLMEAVVELERQVIRRLGDPDAPAGDAPAEPAQDV